ncbi:hypothetical protein T439DRAFT_357180 [Meredithblackwellia eburnea MCA 4105]
MTGGAGFKPAGTTSFQPSASRPPLPALGQPGTKRPIPASGSPIPGFAAHFKNSGNNNEPAESTLQNKSGTGGLNVRPAPNSSPGLMGPPPITANQSSKQPSPHSSADSAPNQLNSHSSSTTSPSSSHSPPSNQPRAASPTTSSEQQLGGNESSTNTTHAQYSSSSPAPEQQPENEEEEEEEEFEEKSSDYENEAHAGYSHNTGSMQVELVFRGKRSALIDDDDDDQSDLEEVYDSQGQPGHPLWLSHRQEEDEDDDDDDGDDMLPVNVYKPGKRPAPDQGDGGDQEESHAKKSRQHGAHDDSSVLDHRSHFQSLDDDKLSDTLSQHEHEDKSNQGENHDHSSPRPHSEEDAQRAREHFALPADPMIKDLFPGPQPHLQRARLIFESLSRDRSSTPPDGSSSTDSDSHPSPRITRTMTFAEWEAEGKRLAERFADLIKRVIDLTLEKERRNAGLMREMEEHLKVVKERRGEVEGSHSRVKDWAEELLNSATSGEGVGGESTASGSGH